MQRHRLLPALALLLACAMPAAARLDLSREEREIVEWSQPAKPALAFDASILRLLTAEDVARRILLLERCPLPLWSSPVRFANPRYAAVMSEAGRAADNLVADAVRRREVLPNEWATAAIATWRAWSAPQRQAWLAYMQSADARRGSEWHWTMAAFDAFPEAAIHSDTGAPTWAWPAWTAEFLAKAGLSARFIAAANAIETGLGDRFSAEAARTVAYPMDPAQQKAIADLIERLRQHWPAIAEALRAGAAADTANAARSWTGHPQVREIEARIMETRAAATRNPSGPRIVFSRESQLLPAIDIVLMRSLRPTGRAMCRQLQP